MKHLLILLLALPCLAEPSKARQQAMETRWTAYSLTNSAVQSYRVTLSKLYPIQRDLNNRMDLLRQSARLQLRTAAGEAMSKQISTLQAQLDKVEGDIVKSKNAMGQIKAAYLLSIQGELPR